MADMHLTDLVLPLLRRRAARLAGRAVARDRDNYTWRYCKECGLLIAHKLEIEHHLAGLFRTQNAEAIGNEG